MRTAFACLALLAATFAGDAQAARLCRDSKGLFTPCAGSPALKEHFPQTADTTNEPVSSRDAKPSKPRKPEIIAKTKLCRDSKGLFTPCR